MPKSSPKPRLARQDWIDAALQTLASAGIGAVTIDRLAGDLGVTRGSFYHHFDHREELLRALLDDWAQKWTYTIREQVTGLGLDPGTTLLVLMRTVRSSRATDYDAPIRAWAVHDSIAREVVSQVDAVRLGFIRAQFEALGFEGIDAENRSRLLLHYEIAAPALFVSASTELQEKLLVERHRFLTTARSE